MSLAGLEVKVVGGGIGGLSVATVLAQRGANVVLYEQAKSVHAVGAGVQISANGQMVLHALSVADGLSRYVSGGTDVFVGSTGRFLARVPSPKAGATWYVHRADLLTVLYEAALAAGVQFIFGKHLSPPLSDCEHDSDLIVAADGCESTWRCWVDGPVSSSFSGQVAWRALITLDEPLMLRRSSLLALGRGMHVVAYPIGEGSVINVVAVESRDRWMQDVWRHRGCLEDFRSIFGGFNGAAGDWLKRVETVHVWGLHVRPVAKRWYVRNVVLLGDAVHPSLPFIAQGACLALEDGWVLADALERSSDVDEGLALYVQARYQRVSKVVALARRNAFLFHLPRPWSYGVHLAMQIGADKVSQRLEWIYVYDATRILSSR